MPNMGRHLHNGRKTKYMTHDELALLSENLMKAACPEDVFGTMDGKTPPATALKKTFVRLTLACHPDRFASESDAVQTRADTAFKRLNEFYREAAARLNDGTYGKRLPMAGAGTTDARQRIQTPTRSYAVGARIAEGDVADLYAATYDDAGKTCDAILKIARTDEDDAFIDNEAEALPRIDFKSIPKLIDAFTGDDGRHAIILEDTRGVDLLRLGEKFPRGVEAAHACWIFQRALAALGYVHKAGIIHGNLAPAHLMVRPSDHNAFVIDFTYAAIEPMRTGAGFKGLTEPYSPPEAAERKPPIPASDLYALGKCMVFLLGGDPETNAMPTAVPTSLRTFLKRFLVTHPLKRPQDAWAAHEELKALRESLFGSLHRFQPFTIPD